MRRIRCFAMTVLCLALTAAIAQAQWVEITDGIEYRDYTLPGPIRVFVTRADRTKDGWIFDTMTSEGRVGGGMETVPDMVEDYDDSVTFDGRRYEIKSAVNGTYFNMRTGVASSGQITGGWYALRFGEYSGGTGMLFKANRDIVMGANVRNDRKFQRAVFAGGKDLAIDRFNEPRGKDELALYTPQYNKTTGTSNDGVEVILIVDAPLTVVPTKDQNQGTVVAIRKKGGGTPLPFDHVVLSGQGKAAAKLLDLAKIGQKVWFDLSLRDFGNEALKIKPGQDWTGTWAALTGHCYCLVDGVVHKNHWEDKARRLIAQGKKHGSVKQDPRTALAYNDRYLYFVVIDGRSGQSKGMTFTQVGAFCRDELKARWAILQDGGGSSTMDVNGQIKNVPSDGRPRKVANGFLIGLVHKPEFSDAFKSGQSVRASVATEVRLGPGTNFGPAGKVASGARGKVLKHRLTGVRAKGTHWFKCKFGKTEGWVAWEQLR